VHVKALFKKNLREDTHLVVVNTKPVDDLLQQYCALSNEVQYVCSSFEEIVHDDKMADIPRDVVAKTVGNGEQLGFAESGRGGVDAVPQALIHIDCAVHGAVILPDCAGCVQKAAWSGLQYRACNGYYRIG